MDHKDRLEERVPSHHGPRQHPQVLPVRCSWDSLSIPGPPVWTINSSKGIHQDSSPCDPAASLSRHPGPCLLGRLDNSCHFSRTEFGTYTTHYTTSTITGMDNQLGQINVTTLQNPGLPGFTFQLRTSPHISSGLILTNSHRGPIPSIAVDGHVCSESFIHHQPDVTFCPIYIQRQSSSTVSPVLVKKTMTQHQQSWDTSVLPKVFWAPVLRTSGSWNLPVRMEGSLVRNFNNYYVLLIHVFDGCSNRLDPCDHFNLVCCCLSPVLISDKRSCWKISQSLKPIWLDVEMLVPL